MQALVDRHRQFVDNMLTNGKPMKFTQDGRDVIKLPSHHTEDCYSSTMNGIIVLILARM